MFTYFSPANGGRLDEITDFKLFSELARIGKSNYFFRKEICQYLRVFFILDLTDAVYKECDKNPENGCLTWEEVAACEVKLIIF